VTEPPSRAELAALRRLETAADSRRPVTGLWARA
jgi:hypothetical protein